jgi:hypothetical protein
MSKAWFDPKEAVLVKAEQRPEGCFGVYYDKEGYMILINANKTFCRFSKDLGYIECERVEQIDIALAKMGVLDE